ncbi:hypothetical protein KI688_011689 [Linnemannia hyalina]|uniref:Uncharacterized protein n=1 Tax=Linnemannia hyalina TaxID=64524 RepID=A0A9P8BWP1_9FUNG|nr:hypothetical protein KI688_011689 [Linnemannia hyalina]
MDLKNVNPWVADRQAKEASQALTSCIPSEDDHRCRLSLPAPVHNHRYRRRRLSHPESVNYHHDSDVDNDMKQLIQEIVATDKNDDRGGGNNNDLESLIMNILASAIDGKHQDGNGIEVDLLIQEFLESSAGKPKQDREAQRCRRDHNQSQSRWSSPAHAVETSANVSASLGKRSIVQTDMGAETKEVKRPRDELNDNGSSASGKTTGTANRPSATTDTNSTKRPKRPSDTPLVRASCKMFKADLTSTTRKPKNMTDLAMLRKEHEVARQTRLATMPAPRPHNDDMDKETEGKKQEETKVKEKETTMDTEEKGENPKTLLDDLLASIHDHNKRYNLAK